MLLEGKTVKSTNPNPPLIWHHIHTQTFECNPIVNQNIVSVRPDINSPQLTNKLYGLLKVGAYVGHVAVLHWDPLVVVVALGRLQVSAWHVEQGRDVKIAEIVLSGGMVGTTKVEERQDLDRFTLKGKRGGVSLCR